MGPERGNSRTQEIGKGVGRSKVGEGRSIQKEKEEQHQGGSIKSQEIISYLSKIIHNIYVNVCTHAFAP